MSSVYDSRVSMLSLNVRGLKNNRKRKSLFYEFKKGNFDIIGIQDSHLTLDDKEQVQREWGGNFYM